MHVIPRYITAQIGKYFTIVTALVAIVYITVDFFEKIDNFMEAGVPLSKAFTYFICKIPFILAQTIPVCVLLSVLIAFGLMIRNNEIIAIQAGGGSIYYLVKPVLILGFFFTILLFILSEMIVPVTMEKANRIWLNDVRKESSVITREKNIWMKGNHLITHVKYYNPEKKAIYGITQYGFDENFKLIRRIDSLKGMFTRGKWILNDIIEQNLDKKGENYDIKLYKQKEKKFDFVPEDLTRVIKKSDEMSFVELYDYIKRIESEGFDATVYKVDLYAKSALPFICIIMCMVGTGISLRAGLKEGIPVSIAFGIGIAFLYWVFYSLCMSLGYGEMLPPWAAAYSADLVFLCFGILTLINAE